MNARSLIALVATALMGCADTGKQDAFLRHTYSQLLADYAHVVDSAEAVLESVQQFCDSPAVDRQRASQAAFERLALAFGRVEWLRRGRIAIDHRYERLFYWPDRGGRGRRALVRLLDSDELKTLSDAALAKKSVALQGLPALEYLLYGEALIPGETLNGERCRLAELVAQRIAATSREVSADWADAGDLRSALAEGQEKVLTRDRALSVTLQSAAVALEVAADQKIAPAASQSAESARPGLAPLAMSGHTVGAMLATIAALDDLFRGPFQDMLPEASRYAGDALLRELQQITTHLVVLDGVGSWAVAVSDATHHRRLLYVRQPMLAAKVQLEQSLSPALGLVRGFNSADGD
ncbi:MAG: imelysin family protein [Pseudomonadota bacterium]